MSSSTPLHQSPISPLSLKRRSSNIDDQSSIKRLAQSLPIPSDIDMEDNHSDSEEEEEVVRRKLDKGKGRARDLPELPGEVWRHIFQIFNRSWQDAWDDDMGHSHTSRSALTPLLISKELTAITLPLLYAHPHLSFNAIPKFLDSISYPARYVKSPKAAYVTSLTIKPSPKVPGLISLSKGQVILPGGRTGSAYSIHPQFEEVLHHFPDLYSFTLRDTLIQHQADATRLFDGLRLIRPKKARLEIRMWNLFESPVGEDIMAVSRPSIYSTMLPPPPFDSSAVDGMGSRPHCTWRDALHEGYEWEMPMNWVEVPTPAPNASATANQNLFGAAPAFPPPQPPHLANPAPAVLAGLGNNPVLFPNNPSATSSSHSQHRLNSSSSSTNPRSMPRGYPSSPHWPRGGADRARERASSGSRSGPTTDLGLFNSESDSEEEEAHQAQMSQFLDDLAEIAEMESRALSSQTRHPISGSSSRPPPGSRHNPIIERDSSDSEDIETVRVKLEQGEEQSVASASGSVPRTSRTHQRNQSPSSTQRSALQVASSSAPTQQRSGVGVLLSDLSQGSTSPAVVSTIAAALGVPAETRRDRVRQAYIAKYGHRGRNGTGSSRTTWTPWDRRNHRAGLGSVAANPLPANPAIATQSAYIEEIGTNLGNNPSTAGSAAPRVSNAPSISFPPPPLALSNNYRMAHNPITPQVATGMSSYYTSESGSTGSTLAHEMRFMLRSLITDQWEGRIHALSLVALDPLASVIFRAPHLDLWTALAVPHIRVHLPRGIHSLAVLKGAKETSDDYVRIRRDPNEPPIPAHKVRIVGGDGNGGELLHDEIRLFEIEVNTISEMRDEQWIQYGHQIPPQVCRILVGEQDWRSVQVGASQYAATPGPALSTPARSPLSDSLNSPTFSFQSLDSDDEEPEDLFGMGADSEGDTYDSEAAEAQSRMIAERKAARTRHLVDQDQ